MEHSEKNHIVSYRTYLFILLALIVLTGLSILVTSINLGALAVTAALVFASLKTTLVLLYFMHLKFDQRIFAVMVGLVMIVFIIVMVITFLDYSFR
jgi:cytochrome c oxidase subunit 4